MTGPEHYLEAERLADQAHDARGTDKHSALVAESHLHATLALVVATALRGSEGQPTEDRHAWTDAASTCAARKRGTTAAVRVA
jgi:hypothetical protein